MNIDELRSVQSKERQTDSLQHLRASFYEDVSAYISDLERARDSEAATVDDPFADPEVRQLTDEIETAREVVEAIYNRRLGKLVKRASLAAADMPTDEDGLTAEEQELYADLVDRIEANKSRVLDVLDTDVPQGAASTDADRDALVEAEAEAVVTPEGDGTDAGAGEAPAATDPQGGEEPEGPAPTGGEPGQEGGGPDAGPSGERQSTEADGQSDTAAGDRQPDGGAATADSGGLDARTTVRITGDVGEFYGVDDREYDLAPEDVVTLPEANAAPLLQSGDAERVD